MVASLESNEDKLAGFTDVKHAASEANGSVGHLAGFETTKFLHDFGNRGRKFHTHRVGVACVALEHFRTLAHSNRTLIRAGHLSPVCLATIQFRHNDRFLFTCTAF